MNIEDLAQSHTKTQKRVIALENDNKRKEQRIADLEADVSELDGEIQTALDEINKLWRYIKSVEESVESSRGASTPDKEDESTKLSDILKRYGW